MVFDPHFIARLLPELLQGAVVTVELAVLTMLICLACALRRRISFPLALSLCLLAFFSTNKQAFANYYYLVIGALLCGVCGLAAGNEVGGVAAPVQHNLDPPVGRAGR